jgi:hypothetical protein
VWSAIICADINRLRNSYKYTSTNSNSNKLINAANPMFCNLFWTENAWDCQDSRTVHWRTRLLFQSSWVYGSDVRVALTRVSSQHDVACNDP